MNNYPLVTGIPLPKPLRRALYQLDAAVAREEMTAKNRYESAIQLVWLWLEKKTQDMPELAALVVKNQEEKAELNHSYSNSVRLRTTTVEEEGRREWAMSFSHPDVSVPTRVWETQAVLRLDGECVRLFAELSFSVAIEVEEPEPSVPGFVRDIARNIGLAGGAPLNETAWLLEGDDAVEWLYRLVTEPERNLPVVVVSQPDRRKWPFSTRAPEYLVSAKEIAAQCFGRCFVIQLPYFLGFRWSARVGRLWSVFDGGVRIYRPGLNFDEDDIYTHTLYAKGKILNWTRAEGERSYERFEKELIAALRREPTLLAPGQERRPFSGVYQKKLETERKLASSSVENLRKSYETQLQDLREELRYQKELADDSYGRYQQYERDNKALQAENHNLTLLADSLRTALSESGQNGRAAISIPDTYEEMEEWCGEYLPDKLVFTPRARRAIKDTENLYNGVHLVYDCLLLLGNEYHDVKMGKGDGKALQQRLDELQVENRPAANLTQAGMYEEEYYYTDERKKKHLVEMHLTKGKGRDTRNLLRIYYYWDEEKQKVVIVSLTKHLTTAAT